MRRCTQIRESSKSTSTHKSSMIMYNHYFFRELQASTREALEKLAMAEAKASTMQTGKAHTIDTSITCTISWVSLMLSS